MRVSNRTKHIVSVAAVAALWAASVMLGQNPGDTLEQGFLNPPDSAKPRVWWHWMNGNITKEGIKADLEWMKRAGIGGFQNFDASLNTPQVVQKRLVYMTPEWKDAFRYTATLADQLGLEMAIAGSPGWSESGGPWVPAAQGMKKLVWSETRVDGGRPFSGVLAKPPTTTGPFQNIPGGGRQFGGGPPYTPPQYYADVAVVAFRVPESDRPLAELHPKVTSSGGSFDLASLTDGDLAKTTTLPAAPVGQKAWIQFEFEQPQAVRGVTLVSSIRRGPNNDTGQALEASDDGRQFQIVTALPRGGPERTVTFAPVTAKFFRVTFKTFPPPPAAPGGAVPAALGGATVAEIILHSGARVNRFEEKAAFVLTPDPYSLATSAVSASDAIGKAAITDLTSKMRPDGTLDWTPPPGRWAVLRMGYSLLGISNHPASFEATGLEVDKLNRTFVKAYMDNYLNQYQETLGELMGKRGLQYVITDSYEAGAQNWTDDMIAEFAKRRGYDMRLWLPALTGRVIESAESSDRFLWDFRRTLADLMAENHYDQIGASLHEKGMGRYTESHESGRALIADGMEVKRKADIPMSAMWVQTPGVDTEQYGYNADIRESASVAHIYGQNLVAAESLTANGNAAWAWSPETLKPIADKELAMGLNRFVIHTSVHQPVDDKIPGLGLGPFGQWFTRHETWAEQARPWTTYLSRSCYMLQQGKFIADVLYFYGEDSNITALFSNKQPEVPVGYNFDFVNADALLHRVTAVNGRITTPTGMSYRLLALDPNSRYMTLAVLHKMRDLVAAGVAVVGAKPESSPSLGDDPAEFRRISTQVWGSATGKVFAGQTIAQALAALQVAPDFEHTKPHSDTNLLFVHRRLADGEIYWVDSRNNRSQELQATFRVQGKAPEFWYPETGKIEPASYQIAGGRTTVPLRLQPNEAVFVVFRKTATSSSRTLPVLVGTELLALEGPWEISFQADRGAPAKLTMDRLASWTENTDPGVKYFSGAGTYSKTLQVEAAWFKPGAHLWLDLGEVKNLAEVSVNGGTPAVVWKTPFRVDVTGAIKPGANTVTIKVINLWVNRLIGDRQPDVARKYTYTTQPFYRADSPLLPSGLLGPVRLVRSINPILRSR